MSKNSDVDTYIQHAIRYMKIHKRTFVLLDFNTISQT